MTCEPFCDTCGGNLGHPANGDWVCEKCKAEKAWSDEQIERVHGNHKTFSIAAWRRELGAGETALPYIDWRADKLFYQGRNNAPAD